MINTIWNIASTLITTLDNNFAEYSPTTLIAGTIAATLLLQKTYHMQQRWDTKQIKQSFMNKSIQLLEQVPYIGPKVKAKIDKEVKDLLSGIKSDIDAVRADWDTVETLPEVGLSEDAIRRRFEKLTAHYKAGKLSGAVYAEYDEKLSKLLQEVWGKTALTNPMHSEWPLINLMEAEIVSMCQNLLHGQRGAPGIITHGGSTSILEACKAYVLQARKNGNEHPEIIVPDTIHVAFDKAADILHVKLIKIPVDQTTGEANVTAMEKAITKNTCLMVGSAPSFPFGIIDPINRLGKVALQHNIALHVDGCLGGFLTPFAQEAGFDIPGCDFSIPGVTSISIDTHKYGQTPKGTSVLLFNHDSPATPTHVYLDWVGGMYVTPSIDGSRSGADIATVWTVLCHKGKAEYINETKNILTLQRELLSDIKKIDGLFIPFNPQLSVIPIQSNDGINALVIADRLAKAGWSVNILQTPEQNPAGFHFCLTSVHTQQNNFKQLFIADLTEAVKYAKANPNEKPKGQAKAYGKLEKGVPQSVQERIGKGYQQILNTLPNIPIKGIWSLPENKAPNHDLPQETNNLLSLTKS